MLFACHFLALENANGFVTTTADARGKYKEPLRVITRKGS